MTVSRVRHKADKTLVTDADTGIERMVRDRLATVFPEDRIMGEEEGGTWEGAGRVWIVDPIDGTANFARAIPIWATLIALQVDGESSWAWRTRRRSASGTRRSAAAGRR